MCTGLHCSPGSSPSWVWPAAEHFFVRPTLNPWSIVALCIVVPAVVALVTVAAIQRAPHAAS